MITNPRQRPSSLVVEGHEFADWEAAEQLADDARQQVDRISGPRDFDLEIMRQLDEMLKDLEGDLVPTCTCGWRGYAEPWMAPRSRSRSGGQQHISHKHGVQMDRISQRLAADLAAAALWYAAEAWTEGDEVPRWLEARAEHIESVGLCDGLEWP